MSRIKNNIVVTIKTGEEKESINLESGRGDAIAMNPVISKKVTEMIQRGL